RAILHNYHTKWVPEQLGRGPSLHLPQVRHNCPQTRYWKGGQPAKFGDIKVGDKLRTKTHGVGKGKVRVCWEVFLDDASLLKFQAEQQAVHRKRMLEEGLPGYVDRREDRQLQLTLFQETRDLSKESKAGRKVRVAPAGVDRKPTEAAVEGVVQEVKPM